MAVNNRAPEGILWKYWGYIKAEGYTYSILLNNFPHVMIIYA